MEKVYLGEEAKKVIISQGIKEDEISDYLEIDKFHETLVYDHDKFDFSNLSISKDDNYEWSIALDNEEVFDPIEMDVK